jgi:hypothetical protein
MQRTLLASAAVCLALSQAGRAQSFNIDVGTGNAIPSPALGAAASQPGTWNQVQAINTVQPLSDLTGAATTVTIQRTLGGGSDFYFNNSTTSGDDELLLDDGEFPLTMTPSVWTISGLSAGSYTVTTYAWAPDSAALFSGVSVNGGPITPVGGTWTGMYQLGVTHALDTVTIPAGGTIAVTISTYTTFATFDGLQIQQNGSAFASYCSGDGSGTACPCANSGSAGNGCASSVSTAGAHLAAGGSPSIGSDTLVLTGTLMPNSSALYFQGTARVNAGLGAMFGDGLRCAGGTIIRLGTKTNAGGTSSYPSGSTPISVKGANSAGALRDYQCWYRNAAAFCTASTFNLTNAVEVTWTP